ncbi:MAG: hypothetical protein ACXWZB_01845 [Gaiellaceae bacterium]
MRRLTLVALALAFTQAGGVGVAVPGANGKILFRGFETNDLYAMDANGAGQTRLTFSSGENEQDPVWSPDGTKIAYTGDAGNGDIVVLTADGSAVTNLTGSANPGTGDREATWSPDGAKIAFTTERVGVGAIWTMNADGSGQSPLVSTFPASNFEPAWSPDGTRLAFVSNRNGDLELYVASALDGSGQTRLTNRDGLDQSPAWSPDGASIAFSRADPATGQQDIAVMNADGTGVVLITNDAASDAKPAWSPDGTRIAWERNVGGQTRIFVANADGTAQLNLTPESSAASPDWQTAPAPPPPAAPCILVGPATTVDLGTSVFSTATSTETVESAADVSVQNCGSEAVELALRATDATGGARTWNLADVGADPCGAGIDRYGLAFGALVLVTQNRSAGSLGAGATLARPLRLTMPCNGSVGAGATLQFQVVVTATS